MTEADIHRTIATVFRMERATLIAGLARMVRDVGQAEELAQDARVVARSDWPVNGAPRNPGSWLMAAAKRRAIDGFRRYVAIRSFTDQRVGPLPTPRQDLNWTRSDP